MSKNEQLWQQLSSSTAERGQELFSKRSADYEAAFLLRHLKPGLDVLDCGCAEGSITLGLADAVYPGKVIGIDIRGDSIAKARATASKRGISNVDFREASVYELPFEDAAFSVLYANALFEWLIDPAKAVREMYRVLKPGGLLAARSGDAVTRVWWPTDELVERFWSVFYKWRASVRADDLVGRKLSGLLQAGGLTLIGTSISSQPRGTPGAFPWYGKFWADTITSPNDLTNGIIERGLASKAELEAMANALIETSVRADAFIAIVEVEVLARKPE